MQMELMVRRYVLQMLYIDDDWLSMPYNNDIFFDILQNRSFWSFSVLKQNSYINSYIMQYFYIMRRNSYYYYIL
jgi:hypothetical protein